MRIKTKMKDEKVPKIDIFRGSFDNPQEKEQSRRDDLERIEKDRRSKLN